MNAFTRISPTGGRITGWKPAWVLAMFAALSLGAVEIDLTQVDLPEKLRQALEKVDFESYDVNALPSVAGIGAEATTAPAPGLDDLAARHAGDWRVQMDARAGTPLMIEGAAIPLIPGPGNSLARTAGAGGTAPEEATGLAAVAAATTAFLADNQALLQASADTLVLDRQASVGIGRNNRFWSLRYQAVFHDPDLGPIPIRDAHVFFRINQGNLVQFGNQLAVAPRGIDAGGILSRQQLIDRARALFDEPAAVAVSEPVVDVGQGDRTLQIVPALTAGGALRHQLVRSLVVETDDLGLELWFDARSGELVYALDRRLPVTGAVRGGIYPETNSDPEVSRGLSFVEVDNGGVDKTTDLGGGYDYDPPGSTASASFSGDFLRINDACGSSSLSTSADPGDLDFGTGPGTDCATPGAGGAGNTHAARSTYYHVGQIQEKARRYLNDPVVTTPWLEARLTANVNVDNTCNAFWGSGGTINFYRSGGGCSNTGEIAAIFLHEFGHGLDDRTNGPPPEKGSGEAYGDTMAMLQTHDSCIGDNFKPGSPCIWGCGPDCTGVRDVAVRPPVSPTTIAMAPADCDRTVMTPSGPAALACPHLKMGFFPYQGPMGYEGHCESLIASGAVWDMIQGFVARYGDGAGWALADRIWYESLYLTGSAYQLVSGGKCNPFATVDGCGATNWYTVFLSLDDDNGNLADGTPNADLIWTAFNDHGIACGAAPPPVSSSCPTLAAPTLTAVTAGDRIELSWTAVTGAAAYRVFRNDLGCDRGSTPIAEVAAPGTAYSDGAIDPQTTYFYAVQAIGGNDLCTSRFSSCISAGVCGSRLLLSPGSLRLRRRGAASSASLTATLTDCGAPLPGVTLDFIAADTTVATVTSAAVTDAEGRATVTVAAQARGETQVRAETTGTAARAPVRVPAASTWGLAIGALLALLVLGRLRRPFGVS